MPTGAFDRVGGIDVPVRTDGRADVGVAAPVREAELVTTGGIRGETRPGPVNSIVEYAPVRTETSSTGDSSVIREPSINTGSGGAGRDDDANSSRPSDNGADEGGGESGVALASGDGTPDPGRSGAEEHTVVHDGRSATFPDTLSIEDNHVVLRGDAVSSRRCPSPPRCQIPAPSRTTIVLCHSWKTSGTIIDTSY